MSENVMTAGDPIQRPARLLQLLDQLPALHQPPPCPGLLKITLELPLLKHRNAQSDARLFYNM
jgi:hypothetical protein